MFSATSPCASSPCMFGGVCVENETESSGYICQCNVTCGCFTDEDILDEFCSPGN